MCTEQSNLTVMAQQYKEDVMKLAAYIPWLEKSMGNKVSSIYESNEDLKSTISFPVYDSNLLKMVKVARNTQFMNKNYAYVYSRNHIRNVQDELTKIDAATALEFDVLSGILSKYVMQGMTKSAIWSDGVTQGVFYHLFTKMKEIVDFWCQK